MAQDQDLDLSIPGLFEAQIVDVEAMLEAEIVLTPPPEPPVEPVAKRTRRASLAKEVVKTEVDMPPALPPTALKKRLEKVAPPSPTLSDNECGMYDLKGLRLFARNYRCSARCAKDRSLAFAGQFVKLTEELCDLEMKAALLEEENVALHARLASLSWDAGPLEVPSQLTAVVAVSHAALPSEVYWHEMLPNTRMPSVIRDLLRPDLVDEKTGTSVGVGKDGVHAVAGKEMPKGDTTVDVGKGGVGVDTYHKGKSIDLKLSPPPPQHGYIYAASEDQLHDNRNVAIFFLEKNLHPGAKMDLHFIKTTPGATFLPRGVAQSIPFSSSKLLDILNKFSISPGSLEAEAVKDTLSTCEAPASKGEDKYCATSLESMVDFAKSKLGTNVQVLTTTVNKETTTQEYTVGSGVKKMVGPKSLACHGQSYVYAVFYCHETSDTTAYTVPLVGKDGTSVESIAMCHKDTSAWDPKQLAFQVLKVKPGSVPICHFLPQDHILWASN
ncbi:BURP domain-containing protein 5-like [Tasmannia lanceolata]|uniref:BURP domain-containing protein 5-like n=1 Tax=Tasmannia lanceolata TaxID=3420 RepID=UPI004064C7DF